MFKTVQLGGGCAMAASIPFVSCYKRSNAFNKHCQKTHKIHHWKYNFRLTFDVWFHWTLLLVKPVEDQPESVEIYLNTDLITGFADGLSTEDYVKMINNLLAILISFRAHGSGWALEKLNQLEVKMAKFQPVRGWSWIALPDELQGRRIILKIRNHRYNRCFMYCFTAAYH